MLGSLIGLTGGLFGGLVMSAIKRDRGIKDFGTAIEGHGGILDRIRRPGFCDTAPYPLPPGRRAHGVPMILTEVTNELLQTTGRADLESTLDGLISEVLDRFLDPRTIDGEVDADCDGTVDVWTEGVYTLTYTAEDAAGNDAEQTREITVTYGAPHTITASAGAGGTISPSGAVIVGEGSNQTFTITPNPGYTVRSVIVDGSNRGAITSFTFTNITSSHTISAYFK